VPPNWSRSIKYFIDTTESVSHLALFHFQIQLHTKAFGFDPFDGFIILVPVGDLRTGRAVAIDPGSIRPNTTYTRLMKVPKDLGRINLVLVRVKQWARAGNALQRALSRAQQVELNAVPIVQKVDFNFMSHYDAR